MNRGHGLLAMLLALSSGCATLFTDNERNIMVTSDPPQAALYKDGQLQGLTPHELWINGMDTLYTTRLTLDKPGYVRTTWEVPTRFQPIAILNLTNVLAWAIDILTGNVFALGSNKLHAVLPKSSETAPPPSSLAPTNGWNI